MFSVLSFLRDIQDQDPTSTNHTERQDLIKYMKAT